MTTKISIRDTLESKKNLGTKWDKPIKLDDICAPYPGISVITQKFKLLLHITNATPLDELDVG